MSSLIGYSHRQFAKFQLFSEAINEIFRVDRIDQEVTPSQSKFFEESLVRLTKFENVELDMYISRQHRRDDGEAHTIRTSEKSMSICWLDS